MTDLAAALAAELAGRSVIERDPGRGSSATVYLARDLRRGRRAALKLLHTAPGQAQRLAAGAGPVS